MSNQEIIRKIFPYSIKTETNDRYDVNGVDSVKMFKNSNYTDLILLIFYIFEHCGNFYTNTIMQQLAE